jgi:hypothetical protein
MVIGEGGKAVENPARTSYGTFLVGSALKDPVVMVRKNFTHYTCAFESLLSFDRM